MRGASSRRNLRILAEKTRRQFSNAMGRRGRRRSLPRVPSRSSSWRGCAHYHAEYRNYFKYAVTGIRWQTYLPIAFANNKYVMAETAPFSMSRLLVAKQLKKNVDIGGTIQRIHKSPREPIAMVRHTLLWQIPDPGHELLSKSSKRSLSRRIFYSRSVSLTTICFFSNNLVSSSLLQGTNYQTCEI